MGREQLQWSGTRGQASGDPAPRWGASMDLRRLRYFVAVAEELHFGRAAEKVCVVQSAVSQQIKLLEEELGFALFERTRQKVLLTVPGEIFLPEARAILRRTEEGLERVRASADGLTGRLTIGFVDNVLWAVLSPVLRAFRSQAPNIDVKLHPLNRVPQLEAIQGAVIDIGIMPSPLPPHHGIDSMPFLSGRLLAAVPEEHPLAGRREIALRELAAEPFVLFPRQMHSRLLEIILNGCSAADFLPHVSQEAEQLHTLLALVSAGLGVTLVPEWVARAHPVGVSYSLLTDPLPRYELMVTWRSGSTNPAIQRFRTVAETIAPISGHVSDEDLSRKQITS